MNGYRPGPIEGVSEEVNACIPSNGILHAYVWWAQQTTHAPPWWHVGAGLSIVAAEAARLGFVIGNDQQQLPSVWLALLGPSAAGKSTAIGRAMDFYRDYLEDQTLARDPWVMAEGSIQGIFEKLTEGWDDETQRTLGVIYAEEFSRLLDTKQPINEMLVQLSDNRSMERHLRGARERAKQGVDPHTHLRNPCLSALLATTYDSLRRVTTLDHFGGGLFSRILWFVDEPNPSALQMLPNLRLDARRVVMEQWRDWRSWLLGQELVVANHRRIHVPEAVHHILEDSLFAEAKRRLTEDDKMNASRVRAVTQAYRVAGLLALSCGRLTVISEDMDCAVNLVEKCQRGFEDVVPELGTPDLMKYINLAFRVIRRGGAHGVPRSRLYAALQTNKKTIEEVLHTLIDEGSIREQEIKTGRRGRPPRHYIACGPTRFAGDDVEGDIVALHGAEGLDDQAQGG